MTDAEKDLEIARLRLALYDAVEGWRFTATTIEGDYDRTMRRIEAAGALLGGRCRDDLAFAEREAKREADTAAMQAEYAAEMGERFASSIEMSVRVTEPYEIEGGERVIEIKLGAEMVRMRSSAARDLAEQIARFATLAG